MKLQNRDLDGYTSCRLMDALHLRNTQHHNALGIVRSLAYVTCPIALATHLVLSFYSVLFVNAATYALVGMLVAATWR
jgi:hypothetical protein